MPGVPLVKHKQRNVEDNDGPENDNDVDPIFLEPLKTHVALMAKRIAQAQKKKRMEYKPPFGEDLTDSDSDNSIPDRAWEGDVDNDIVIVHQWEDKASSESDGGWDFQAGMPMTPR